MNVLVTGGGGFLGSAIVRRLVARGDRVRTIQRSQYAWHRELGVQAFVGDLSTDLASLERAAAGCDAIVHTAARAGVWGAADTYHRANVVGTQNVIRAARQTGVALLVYTSSPSVVFDGRDEEGIDERAPYPARHLNAYSRTKALAEQCVLAANDASLRTVALRPHLIWGPGDPHLVPRIVQRARRKRLRLVGSGEKRVDSTYIDNAANAHLLALDRLADGDNRCAGRAYFISNGEPLPMAELIDRILAAAGLPPVRRRIAPEVAYVMGGVFEAAYRLLRLDAEPPLTRFVARQLSTAHWFDLTAAERELGYRPEVSIDEGMRRLAVWLGQGEPPQHALAPEATGR